MFYAMHRVMVVDVVGGALLEWPAQVEGRHSNATLALERRRTLVCGGTNQTRNRTRIVQEVLYPDDDTLDLLDNPATGRRLCSCRRSCGGSGRCRELDCRHLIVELLLLQIGEALVFGEARDNGAKGHQRHS